jgi:hypothetical protein
MLGMTCYVYLIVADMNSLPIRESGHGDKVPFKIGIAEDLKKRLGLLQVGNPLALSLYNAWMLEDRDFAAEVEDRIKKDFVHFRIRGEWFFQSIAVALDGIGRIFDGLGYAQRPIIATPAPVPVAYVRHNPFERRVLELIDEYGKEFDVGGTPAIQHVAHLTAVAEKARMDYERDETRTVSLAMVKRAEEKVVAALQALMSGSYDVRLGLGPPRPVVSIRNAWDMKKMAMRPTRSAAK